VCTFKSDISVLTLQNPQCRNCATEPVEAVFMDFMAFTVFIDFMAFVVIFGFAFMAFMAFFGFAFMAFIAFMTVLLAMASRAKFGLGQCYGKTPFPQFLSMGVHTYP